MSEKQARRPPVAPKPSFAQQDAATTSPRPSPALRGAASAFSPPTVKASNATASHNPSASAGALLAAAAAANRKQQLHRDALPSHELSAASRGRALTADKLPVAVSDNAVSPPKGFRPQLPRSTSAVAAVAASTKTSPVRRPDVIREVPSSHQAPRQSSQTRSPGASTGNTHDVGQPSQRTQAALAGALASMAAAPVQDRNVTGERHRNDVGYLSHLNVQSSQPSTATSPSPSGTAAAATATRNAATLEARRRALSGSGESSPSGSTSRNLQSSPQPSAEFSRPRIQSTPSETDSDHGTMPLQAEQAYKPLPAPVPLRPSRAAVVAQEQAHAYKPNAPILDARTKMTASSLADAMVASSVASSHAPSRTGSPSPKKNAGPPVPRRRSRSVGVFEAGRQLMHIPGLRSEGGSKTPQLKPLAVRPMRHTLRSGSPEREDPSDEKRGRRHWRRHPNMHHEGDRKRWRDKVTERERKRYEGLWAANRGILSEFDLASLDQEPRRDGTPAADLVVNIVVRDIWDRSRLPRDVLEEIWDLVCPPGSRSLNREEFVVGLWLIDQRLKGRKLPVKVSPSVWSSVRHTQGVRISSKPLQK